MRYKDRERINGMMGGNILATGSKTRWMDMEFSSGVMVGCMKVVMSTIKSMDSEYLHGQIRRNIEGSGKMGNSMDKESFIFQMDTKKMANGLKEDIHQIQNNKKLSSK